MAKKIEKIIQTDQGTMVWCSHEKDYRSSDLFKMSKNGYHYFCDECMDKIVRNKTFSPQDLSKISNQILENLGYDTKSEMPVHKQFEIRNKKWLEHQNLQKRK